MAGYTLNDLCGFCLSVTESDEPAATVQSVTRLTNLTGGLFILQLLSFSFSCPGPINGCDADHTTVVYPQWESQIACFSPVSVPAFILITCLSEISDDIRLRDESLSLLT